MASGTIQHELSVIVTSSPTVAQLQSAKIVMAFLGANNSASRCVVTDFIGDGQVSVSNQDLAGTYQTAYIQWNKTNGTLTCDANSHIFQVCMIF